MERACDTAHEYCGCDDVEVVDGVVVAVGVEISLAN